MESGWVLAAANWNVKYLRFGDELVVDVSSRFLTQLTLFGQVKSAGLRAAHDHHEALLYKRAGRDPRLGFVHLFAISDALPYTVERYSVSWRGCRCRCLHIPTSLGLSLPLNT